MCFNFKKITLNLFNSYCHIFRLDSSTSLFPLKIPKPTLHISFISMSLSLFLYSFIHHIDNSTATFVKQRKMFKSAFLSLSLPLFIQTAQPSRYVTVCMCVCLTIFVRTSLGFLYLGSEDIFGKIFSGMSSKSCLWIKSWF